MTVTGWLELQDLDSRSDANSERIGPKPLWHRSSICLLQITHFYITVIGSVKLDGFILFANMTSDSLRWWAHIDFFFSISSPNSKLLNSTKWRRTACPHKARECVNYGLLKWLWTQIHIETIAANEYLVSLRQHQDSLCSAEMNVWLPHRGV